VKTRSMRNEPLSNWSLVQNSSPVEPVNGLYIDRGISIFSSIVILNALVIGSGMDCHVRY
jgi:hypothetical protein